MNAIQHGIADRLTEIAEDLSMSDLQGWHPIETAPKDGTRILCMDADTGEIRVAVRKQFSDEHYEKYGRHWYEWFSSDEYCPGHTWSLYPTHWMPLPEPPK